MKFSHDRLRNIWQRVDCCHDFFKLQRGSRSTDSECWYPFGEYGLPFTSHKEEGGHQFWSLVRDQVFRKDILNMVTEDVTKGFYR